LADVGKLALHHPPARPTEPVRALVQALKAVQVGVGGHHAGNALVVAVVVKPTVVTDLVDASLLPCRRFNSSALSSRSTVTPHKGDRLFTGHLSRCLPAFPRCVQRSAYSVVEM